MEQIKRTLKDSPAARWFVLFVSSAVMFMNYYFYDALSPLKDLMQTNLGFSSSDYGMFMSAYSNYLLSPSYRLDQTYSKQAIDELQTFVNTYPNSERVSECNNLIDELRKKLEKKAIARADLYKNMSRYQAAVQSYEIVLQDYPETQAAEKIRYHMTEAQYKLAKKSIYSKRRERYANTLELADQFLKRYSDSEYADEVKKFKSDSSEQIKSLLNG